MIKMFVHCRKRIGDRGGSVLLETVLVIPVLMVLLGGVMWLGQLQINRARLLAADRYIAWNRVNRYLHQIPPASLRDTLQNSDPPIFFDARETLGQMESLEREPRTERIPSGNFWWGGWSLAAMEVAASDLVSELVSAPETMWAEARPGRDLEVGGLRSSNPHFLLARAPFEHGEYTGSRFHRGQPVHCDRDLLIDWEAVEDEDWYEE